MARFLVFQYFVMSVICLGYCLLHAQDDLDLVKPHFVIIGQTGVGKSSLANALIGEDPRCTNCTFPVCHDMDSCTKQTSYAVAPWLGESKNPDFTIVDTPGFGDTDEDMNTLIDEMMDILNNDVESTNCLLLLFKATENRFNAALITMLRQMTALFGSSMWNSTMIGISFFPYDEESIHKRNEECEAYPETCRDEEFFFREINRQLNEKFDVGFDLPICFIDSWSQTVGHKDDETEQLHYMEETSKLWNFSASHEEFVFKTIDDILLENEEMKNEINRLNDIISDNITELSDKIEQEIENRKSNESEINLKVDTEIEDRESNDVTMGMKLEETSQKLDDEVAKLNDVEVNLDSLNKSRLDSETSLQLEINSLNDDVDILQDDIGNLPTLEFPLGTIIAWVSAPDKNSVGNDSLSNPLPIGWTKCDGSRIMEGPWEGRLTPDLNLRNVFLRGGQDGQELEYEEDMLLDHEHIDSKHSHSDAGHTHGHEDTTMQGIEGGCGLEGCNWHMTNPTYSKTTQTSYAKLSSEYSGIGKVKDGYAKGYETRPKNVKVVWLMRTS